MLKKKEVVQEQKNSFKKTRSRPRKRPRKKNDNGQESTQETTPSVKKIKNIQVVLIGRIDKSLHIVASKIDWYFS